MTSQNFINIVFVREGIKRVVRGRVVYEDDETIQLKTRAGFIKTIRKREIV